MLSHPFPSYSPAGWYSRATPFPYELPYEILEKNFAFGVETSSLAVQGPSLALFRPNIAVDAMGRVLMLKQVDWDTLAEAAGVLTNLPRAGRDNMWRIKSDFFCIPFLSIYVPTPDENRVINVEGWLGEASELSMPVGNITHLPDSLQLLLNYSNEVWAHFYYYGGNKAVLADTKKMLRYESTDEKYSLGDLD
ncbi:hypothetical protein B0J17DRAFT_660828 [Rhizoctonia solani]|nr:hypothetical protein B0J17DRAFT_660828 [Rhizoctonia solani]